MKLHLGDCLEVLKNIPDNSVDSIVTDPPYGLSFMNKKWDYDVPSVDIWKECLRVLKPGGHLLAFSGSRTYHRMAVRIEDAGFEIRDQIMWVYGSGFPKSHNIGKAVDKLLGNEREVVGTLADIHPRYNSPRKAGDVFGDGFCVSNEAPPLTKGTSEWEGWGTALKPAHEPIVMARKPLSEKSVAENVLRWGTGGLNIDDSRIGETVETWPSSRSYKSGNVRNRDEDNSDAITQETNEAPNGRWPANIIFECTCDEVIVEGESKKIFNGVREKSENQDNIVNFWTNQKSGDHYQDPTIIHTNPNCPCYILDQQSGISSSGKGTGLTKTESRSWKNKSIEGINRVGHNDKGGASRFFYCPKASKKDRDEGLDGFEEKIVEKGGHQSMMCNKCKKQMHNVSGQCECDEPEIVDYQTPKKNHHPTVKPTALMLYLIKLVTPVKGVVLDPFMGSGSTGKGAIRGGFDFIGIEKEEEYIKIAEARIKNEMNG